MAYKDCIAAISAAAGRDLSDDEIDDLYQNLQSYIRQREKLHAGDGLDKIVRDAADDYAKDMAEAAMIEKRNAAINLRKRLQVMDFVRTRFADDMELGVEAALVGVNRAVPGARLSAAAEQNQLKAHYFGGIVADIESKGLWRAFVSGELDRDITRALWAENRAEPMPVDAPREAQDIARIVSKWQEVARKDANAAGAWIKKMPGYIVRQSHDMYRIRAAGYEAWRDAILPRLDADRTFDGANPDKFLRAAYQGLASGVHLKSGGEGSGFTGPRNIAKKMSAERVLHFKSGDDWFDYNQQFGTGSLREALMRGLEMNAQTTGLMRKLGTNPESTLKQVTDELAKGIDDPNAAEKFRGAVNGRLANQLRELDGTTRMPVNHMAARISSNARIVQRMAKLGGALLSQFGDIAFYGSEMRYQGRSMLSGVAESMAAMAKGKGPRERRELMGMLGAYSQISVGDITSRFSIADDDLPGRLSRMQQMFFKWNGMAWWTDRQRFSAIAAFSHRLAFNRDVAWGSLDQDLKRTLSLFDIDEKDWNAIRSAETAKVEGYEYVVPEAIKDRAIADKLRAYYIDRASFAVIETDQRARALMQRGTRRGTVEGEALRFFGELKAFPVAAFQKAIGREVYGRGSRTLGEALRNGNGEMAGLANLIAWATAFGYMSMAAKDLSKGRTPRDPADPKTWAAAMQQGGGLGIYGDFLFGEMRNRFGGGLLSTVAGPTLGTVDDIADLWGRVKEGDDASAATFRLAMSNLPFANMFYTRVAFDYLFLWSLQEWMNPGSLRRMEKRVQKENAQTFLLRPSRDRVRTLERSLPRF